MNGVNVERVEGYKKVIIYSETPRVKCSGENFDHPLVYYTIPEGGEAVCGYCDIIFRLKEPEPIIDPDQFNNKAQKQEVEHGGPTGPEPTRYGTWEHKGREVDF
mgnify:CR=1 FL=1